jgi:hypothetical protein
MDTSGLEPPALEETVLRPTPCPTFPSLRKVSPVGDGSLEDSETIDSFPEVSIEGELNAEVDVRVAEDLNGRVRCDDGAATEAMAQPGATITSSSTHLDKHVRWSEETSMTSTEYKGQVSSLMTRDHACI